MPLAINPLLSGASCVIFFVQHVGDLARAVQRAGKDGAVTLLAEHGFC